MISLKNIEILKYKSFTTPQSVKIENDITVLVGMNESGKTSVLECLAKTNYFEKDEKFTFNETLDYPRKELKSISKTDEKPKAIICTYELSGKLIDLIENTLGKKTWIGTKEIIITSLYGGSKLISGVKIDFDSFLQHIGLNQIDNDLKTKLKSVLNEEQFNELLSEFPENSEQLEILKNIFQRTQLGRLL
ncbi:AAA family ATPase [Acinetobacter johnsonii]|nr:AAA family ATPase [Acinetobacter johnsonii]